MGFKFFRNLNPIKIRNNLQSVLDHPTSRAKLSASTNSIRVFHPSLMNNGIFSSLGIFSLLLLGTYFFFFQRSLSILFFLLIFWVFYYYYFLLFYFTDVFIIFIKKSNLTSLMNIGIGKVKVDIVSINQSLTHSSILILL